MVEINTNILPLDLILSFNLSQSLLSTFFILCLPTPSRISAYEHASSSRSITDRLNSYNTPLGSEIGTLTLGPLSSGKHRLYHKPMSTVCSLYTLGGKPLISGSTKHMSVILLLNAFQHNSGFSPLQRITLCQCVWHHMTRCHRSIINSGYMFP